MITSKPTPDLRKNPSQITAFRIIFCGLLTQGFTVAAMAMLLCLPLSTLYSWNAAFNVSGFGMIETQTRGRKLGQGRILTPQQEIEIEYTIINYFPVDKGMAYNTWTRKAIADYIFQTYHIKIAERTISDYLKRWKCTFQVPAKEAQQRDPIKVSEWLTITFNQIKALAKKLKAVIFWGDETGIHSESFKAKVVSKRGIKRKLVTTGTRLVKNLMSAISSAGDLIYMTYDRTMNCRVFIRSLNQMVRRAKGQMVFLIVDNLKVHHGKLVQQWLDTHKNQLRIFYLPPYFPDLNPNEYFNNLLKTVIRYCNQAKSKEEFNEIIRSSINKLQRDKAKISRLFRNKNIKYAA
jgi:transposase